jgi:carboxypeptidase C (cathepsin A)
LSPNQANNFEKLTLSVFKKQDNGLIMKKIGSKWKRRQNQYWRVDFALYEVSRGAGDGGVSERVSVSAYNGSHMVPLKFHDSLLFNFMIY